MIDFKKIKRVHFVGLGGIGVSAIAEMFLSFGAIVSGSDSQRNLVIEKLEKQGVRFYKGHSATNVDLGTEMVIYTIAVSDDNPEILKARDLNIETLSYPQALGILSKQMKTVAISGTHGKTTTTAMVAKIAQEAGLQPMVIVGSLLAEEKSNFIPGRGDLLIVEACEYKRSFLNLRPIILAITNIDNDHLDYYRDIEDIESAFGELVSYLPAGGKLICASSDNNLQTIVKDAPVEVIDYQGEYLGDINLRVPGEYNRNNARTALALARALDIDKEKALKSLQNFKGTWRRFEYKGKSKRGALVYDDYAHHPTEIKALLLAVREKYSTQDIVIVFQPHLYSRTKIFFRELIEVLSLADKILLLPIYAAREKEDSSISSDKLARGLTGAILFQNQSSVKKYLEDKIDKDAIILTIGAGDVNNLAESLVAN